MEQSKETELWDAKKVAGAFMLSVRTLRYMPSAKVRGYFNTWPEVIHSEIELLQQEPQYQRYRPSAASISEMEQTLIWIIWIDEPGTRKLIWSRAAGTP